MQALVVSRELIRVAILWHEQWFEGLEEASRYYFNDHNPDGMIAHLEPLHDMVEAVGLLYWSCEHKNSVSIYRGRKLHARRLSLRSLDGTYTKHERHVDGTACMVKSEISRKHGRSIMAYDILCVVMQSLLTHSPHRSSLESRNNWRRYRRWTCSLSRQSY